MSLLYSIIMLIVVGLVAGWLAGLIWKGQGFGLIGNLIIGVAGSFLGGYLFHFLHIGRYGFIGSTVAALVGALILLFIISFIKKKL